MLMPFYYTITRDLTLLITTMILQRHFVHLLSRTALFDTKRKMIDSPIPGLMQTVYIYKKYIYCHEVKKD